MHCSHVQKKLNRYLDGELSAALQIEVGQHLQECSTCRRQTERLKKLEQIILPDPTPPVPDTLLPAVLRMARDRQSPRFHLETSPWVARWATAALLVFGLGLGSLMGITTFRSEPETPPPPETEDLADSVLPRYLDAFGDAPKDSVAAAVLDLAALQDNGEEKS